MDRWHHSDSDDWFDSESFDNFEDAFANAQASYKTDETFWVGRGRKPKVTEFVDAEWIHERICEGVHDLTGAYDYIPESQVVEKFSANTVATIHAMIDGLSDHILAWTMEEVEEFPPNHERRNESE